MTWPLEFESLYNLPLNSINKEWTVEEYESCLTQDPRFHFYKTLFVEAAYQDDPTKNYSNA